jgi:hypothetical protein
MKKIHDKYDDGPIKPTELVKEIREGEDSIFKEDAELYEFYLQFIADVFGHKEVDDFVIIFLHRLDLQCVI